MKLKKEKKKLEETLNEKYDKGEKRLKEFKNNFSGLSNDFKIKYHLNLDNFINI